MGLQNAVVQQTSSATDYFALDLQTRLSDQLVSSRESSDSETSLQQFADDIEECVTCLVKLVPVLRNPAPQNAYDEHSSLGEADGDIDVVKKIFPKATQSLSHRLGSASWRRRKELLSLKSRELGNLPLGRSANNSKQREYDVRQTPDSIFWEIIIRLLHLLCFVVSQARVRLIQSRHIKMRVSSLSRIISVSDLQLRWLDQIT